MNSSLRLVVLALLACVTVAQPASAFDQKRKGFVFEWGLGPSLSTRITGTEPASDGSLRLAGDLGFSGAMRLRLGHGVSDRVTISYVNDNAFSLDSYGFVEDALTLNGIVGIGGRWYSGATAPSWYYEGAAGIGRTWELGNNTSNSGFGFQAGAGFEFARSWSVSLTGRSLLFSEPELDRVAFDLLISHIAY